MTDKPLSPTERAAKIIGMAQIPSRTSIAMIAAEIESACYDALNDQAVDHFGIEYKRQIRAEAYEECAKILLNHPCESNDDVIEVLADIIEKIRTKAKELK